MNIFLKNRSIVMGFLLTFSQLNPVFSMEDDTLEARGSSIPRSPNVEEFLNNTLRQSTIELASRKIKSALKQLSSIEKALKKLPVQHEALVQSIKDTYSLRKEEYKERYDFDNIIKNIEKEYLTEKQEATQNKDKAIEDSEKSIDSEKSDFLIEIINCKKKLEKTIEFYEEKSLIEKSLEEILENYKEKLVRLNEDEREYIEECDQAKIKANEDYMKTFYEYMEEIEKNKAELIENHKKAFDARLAGIEKEESEFINEKTRIFTQQRELLCNELNTIKEKIAENKKILEENTKN